MVSIKVQRDAFLYCNEMQYKKIHLPFFKFFLEKEISFSNEQEFTLWLYAHEHKVSKNYLLYLLGRRDYLKKDLCKKLVFRNISSKVIEKVIKELEAVDLINDHRVLSLMVERCKTKKSRKEIYALLAKKGIDLSFYQDILEGLTEEIETEALKGLIEKKKGLEKKKLISYLLRKGFSYSNIQKLNI